MKSIQLILSLCLASISIAADAATGAQDSEGSLENKIRALEQRVVSLEMRQTELQRELMSLKGQSLIATTGEKSQTTNSCEDCKKQIRALSTLRSVTSVGVNYPDFMRRLQEVQIVLDEHSDTSGKVGFNELISSAMERYRDAGKYFKLKQEFDDVQKNLDVKSPKTDRDFIPNANALLREVQRAMVAMERIDNQLTEIAKKHSLPVSDTKAERFASHEKTLEALWKLADGPAKEAGELLRK